MSTASYETVETANWVPIGRRQRGEVKAGRADAEPLQPVDRGGSVVSGAWDWHARLVCGRCGSRRVDMVVTGERR